LPSGPLRCQVGGVAFLRGLLDGGRDADGSVRFDSVRGTRWRANGHQSTPVYLAAAEGLGFGIVKTFLAG
jgi:hypothetical protein